MQAAILAVKLRHLDDHNAARRRTAGRYAGGLAGLTLPAVVGDASHVYHLYVARHPERDRLRAAFKARGVETQIHYPVPVHLQPAYADLAYRAGSLPETERAAAEIVSLPMYVGLSDGAADAVGRAWDDIRATEGLSCEGPTSTASAAPHCLITGGLGFIGSNLAIRLVEAGADVTLIDAMIPEYGGNLFNVEPIRDRVRVNFGDICDVHAMNWLVRGQDYVFHLAGQVSHVMSLKNPYPDVEYNIKATRRADGGAAAAQPGRPRRVHRHPRAVRPGHAACRWPRTPRPTRRASTRSPT